MESKKKAFFKCSVINCKNTSVNSSYEFNSFPTNNPLFPFKVIRRQIWLDALQKKESDGSPWVPRHHSRICSMHFIGDKKSEHPESPSYNPTIFDTTRKIKTNKKTAVDRFQRRLKRTLNKESNSPSLERPKKRKLSPTSSSTDINESIDNLTNMENTNSVDAETQVYFLSDDDDNDAGDRKGSESFVCKYYTSTSCDVELQVYRPRMTKKPEQKRTPNPETVIKLNTINNIDINKNNTITNRPGFHGYSSIKDASELNDLAGVKLETFQLLLKIMSRRKIDNRMKISLEDQLLIFLMKMRCGLTVTAMGALFSMHRTTISKVFYDTLMYLAGASKQFLIWPTKETVQATVTSK